MSDPRRIPKSLRILSELPARTIAESWWGALCSQGCDPLFLGGLTFPGLSVCCPSCFLVQGTLSCPKSPLKHAPQGSRHQHTSPIGKPPPLFQEETPLLCPPAALTSIWFVLLTPALCARGYTSDSLLGYKISIGMDFSYSCKCWALRRDIASQIVIN